MKKYTYIFTLICLICVSCGNLNAQNRTKDSLLEITQATTVDTNKIKAYRSLSVLYNSISKDSSELFIRKAISLSNKIGNIVFESASCGDLANIYSSVAQYDSALKYQSLALGLRKSLNNKRLIAASLHNLGTVFLNLGEYDKAIDHYYQAMAINDELNNLLWKAYNLIGIGNVYNYRGAEDPKAIKYYEKALKLTQEINNEQGAAFCLNNMGLIYNRMNNYNNAIVSLEKALAINKKLNDEHYIASNLGNLGVSWFYLKDYNKATKYYSEALEIVQKRNERNSISIYLNALGNVFAKLKRFDKAIHYSERSLAIARKIKLQHLVVKSLQSLIEFYVLSKNFEKASNYQAEILVLNDSIYAEKNNKIIAETEIKYQTERKEKENQVLRQQEEIALAREGNQKIISFSISCGLIIVIIFALFIFNRLKVSNKQKRIIELQKQVVDEKQKEILDSITYAKRLQEAILPPANFVEKYLPQSFIYYQPKDIVAGDFYWMETLSQPNNSNIETVLIAAADCTGHGVPGAMVSVVCSTALNRSVNEFGNREPGKILDKTRELVLETFSRSDMEVNDGMDISLASINILTGDVTWSGANNPLWYIQMGVLKEISPNKQAIGKTENPKPFTTHAINLSKGDSLYFITDGYADQFGGPNGKKFKYKSLKNLLLENSELPMAQQKKILSESLTNWMGALEQVDDVCVIGVRL